MGPLLARNVGARKLLVKSKPAFLVDAMLGSVARKLRFFGLDTLYITDSPDDEIIRIGFKENRIILTCDKDMHRRIMKVGGEGTLLNGSNDVEDIAQAFFSYGMMLSPYIEFNSRCSMCNALLAERTHADVKGKLPFKIINWHRRFFECKNCDKLFWEGSHYMSLIAMSKRIDSRIKERVEENNSYATHITSLKSPTRSNQLQQNRLETVINVLVSANLERTVYACLKHFVDSLSLSYSGGGSHRSRY